MSETAIDSKADVTPEASFTSPVDPHDPRLAEGIEQGILAFRKLFEGMVTLAQGVAGPEAMKEVDVDVWMQKLANGMAEAAATLRKSARA